MLGVPGPSGPIAWVGFRLSEMNPLSETIMFADAGVYAAGAPGNVVFSLEYELQQPDPYETVLTGGPYTNIGRGTTSGSPTVHGRHANKTANVSWADGSASNQPVRFEVHTDPQFVDNNLGDLYEGPTPTNLWWDGGVF